MTKLSWRNGHRLGAKYQPGWSSFAWQFVTETGFTLVLNVSWIFDRNGLPLRDNSNCEPIGCQTLWFTDNLRLIPFSIHAADGGPSSLHGRNHVRLHSMVPSQSSNHELIHGRLSAKSVFNSRTKLRPIWYQVSLWFREKFLKKFPSRCHVVEIFHGIFIYHCQKSRK